MALRIVPEKNEVRALKEMPDWRGTTTVHFCGWKSLNYDWVKFAGGAFGVAIALLLKR